MPYNKEDPKSKENNRRYQRQWYLKNQEIQKQRNKKHRNHRKEVAKEYVRKLKSKTPCKDCNKAYPYYVMDFDHIKDKKFEISKRYDLELKSLIQEIEKCEIVCSNCHRIRTFSK